MLQEVLADLHQLSDPRAVAVWEKMGMPNNYIGVGLTKLKTYAKKHKKNHALALELWESGVHDAQLLSCFLLDPKLASEALIEQHSATFNFFDVSDNYCKYVIAKTSFATTFIERWFNHSNEWLERSCYVLLAELAKSKMGLPENYYDKYLQHISQNAQNSRNWVKEGMIYALMAIGSKSKDLNQACLQVLEQTGTLVVDYGETSCVTPNPQALLKSEKIQNKFK